MYVIVAGKFVVVGLLDCTAAVYFSDTLKFFISLYGHSLPVTCCSISPVSLTLINHLSLSFSSGLLCVLSLFRTANWWPLVRRTNRSRYGDWTSETATNPFMRMTMCESFILFPYLLFLYRDHQ